MNAADVMVSNVITVGADASVRDVANVLLANRISAVPVIGAAGELLGIVSEGDLMHRVEAGTGRRRAWWLSLLTGKEALASDYVREHSRKVLDVMTRKVVTAALDASLQEIAGLLEKNHIKRVPIVSHGKVVGIVSRANLLQAVASQGTAPRAADDKAIRENVLARLDAQPWGRTSLVNVIVQEGTVELWGIVDSQSIKEAFRVAAEVTAGVRAVNDNLLIRPAGFGI